MKSLSDHILSIGDAVAFNIRRGKATKLVCGKVTGFTKQMVSVTYEDPYDGGHISSSIMPHNMVKIAD